MVFILKPREIAIVPAHDASDGDVSDIKSLEVARRNKAYKDLRSRLDDLLVHRDKLELEVFNATKEINSIRKDLEDLERLIWGSSLKGRRNER